MSKRDDKELIEDILECISLIEEFVIEMNFNNFYSDRKTRDAVLRNFTVIGEACRLLSKDIKEKYPEVPFIKILDFRNIIVHEYFGVDFELVWDVIKTDLPGFKIELLHLIKLLK